MDRGRGMTLTFVGGVASVLFEFWFGTPGHWIGTIGVLAMAAAAWLHGSRARRRSSESDAEIQRLTAGIADAQSNATLQTALLSSLSIGIAAYRDGVAVFSNPQARADLGTRVSYVEDLLPVSLRRTVEQAAGEGGIQSTRFELDFPARTIEARAHALAPDGVVVVRLIDITERLRTEAVRRDFVAAASHELKTPVAAIQAAAETVLAAMDDDPDAVRQFSERIYDNAARLARIVSDLLDLSRLEAARPELGSVDVGKVATDEAGALVDPEREINLDVDSVTVQGNSADIALAIRNLLDNAIRYTQPGGNIWVKVSSRPDEAIIEVRDDGQGIPSSALSRVFERFYRVDAARSRGTGGTGLGLAIVKHVCEEHGGRVEAESDLGLGSTFRMYLPLQYTDADAE